MEGLHKEELYREETIQKRDYIIGREDYIEIRLYGEDLYKEELYKEELHKRNYIT